MSQTFSCPTCGAPLDYDPGDDPVVRCPYCNASVVVPEELRIKGPSKPAEDATQVSSGRNALDEALRVKQVAELARSGNKIEAIKRYREITGASLSEAKEAVEAIQSGRPVTISHTNLQTSAAVSPAESAKKAAVLNQVARLSTTNKAEAIKLYRETFDTSLAEATEAVNRIASGGFEHVASMALQPDYIPQVRPPVYRRPVEVKTSRVGMWVGCFITLVVLFGLGLTLIPVIIGVSTSLGGNLFKPSFAKVVLNFGDKGIGPGLFTDARSIAVDNNTGNIYVGEYQGGRIQAFDSSGKFITQWMTGSEDTILRNMAAGRDGTVYAVADGHIYRYDGATGELQGQVEYSGEYTYFEDITVTPDGSLATIADSETVILLDNHGRTNLEIPDAVSAVSGDSELDAHIAIDGTGNIYVLGTFNNGIFKFDPSGKYINRFGSPGDEVGQFRALATNAIAIDGQGRIYVSDIKGIQVFDAAGRYLDLIQVDGVAFGMVFNDQGDLFVVSNYQRVYQYTIK